MPEKLVKIGYAQFQPLLGKRDANLQTIERLAEQASGVDLLVFPELCSSGYEFESKEELLPMAEPFEKGPTAELLGYLAKKNSMSIVAGYPEIAEGRLYNSSMLVTPEGILGNYRKLHLFANEKNLFSPGNLPLQVFQTHAGKIGMMVCFDWIFPEVARTLALKGAQILAHPSNLVLQYCQKAMYARSLENGVFSITANRIGSDRKLTFTGASQVLGTKGEILAQAACDKEEVQTVAIDLSLADCKKITLYNDILLDRRPEFYRDLAGF